MFARFLSGAHEPPAGSIDSGVEGGLIAMRETAGTNETNREGLAARWREHFVAKLQIITDFPKKKRAGRPTRGWVGSNRARTRSRRSCRRRDCRRGPSQTRLPTHEFPPRPCG